MQHKRKQKWVRISRQELIYLLISSIIVVCTMCSNCMSTEESITFVSEEKGEMTLKIPTKLKTGDGIRVIAPSKSLGLVSTGDIKQATKVLTSLGYNVSFGKHVYEQDEYQSSSVDLRIEDLHDALLDSNIKLILAAFGGYNCNQILNRIDYDLIKKHPKIICGFSDISALLNAIYAKTGLITYSGPNFSSFGMKKGLEYTLSYFNRTLCSSNEKISIEPSEQWSDDAWFLDQDKRTFCNNDGYWVINRGEAEGHIIGGNLGTLLLLHGSQYMPTLDGAIIFLEEESSGSIRSNIQSFDRALQALIYQPGFDKIRGIVIGRFEAKFGMTQLGLETIIGSKPELKYVPIIANVDFGHTNPIFTFAVGGMCKINTGTPVKIEFREF